MSDVVDLDAHRPVYSIVRCECFDCGFVFMQIAKVEVSIDDCSECKSDNTTITGYWGLMDEEKEFRGTLKEAQEHLPTAKRRLVIHLSKGKGPRHLDGPPWRRDV